MMGGFENQLHALQNLGAAKVARASQRSQPWTQGAALLGGFMDKRRDASAMEDFAAALDGPPAMDAEQAPEPEMSQSSVPSTSNGPPTAGAGMEMKGGNPFFAPQSTMSPAEAKSWMSGSGAGPAIADPYTPPPPPQSPVGAPPRAPGATAPPRAPGVTKFGDFARYMARMSPENRARAMQMIQMKQAQARQAADDAQAQTRLGMDRERLEMDRDDRKADNARGQSALDLQKTEAEQRNIDRTADNERADAENKAEQKRHEENVALKKDELAAAKKADDADAERKAKKDLADAEFDQKKFMAERDDKRKAQRLERDKLHLDKRRESRLTRQGDARGELATRNSAQRSAQAQSLLKTQGATEKQIQILTATAADESLSDDERKTAQTRLTDEQTKLDNVKKQIAGLGGDEEQQVEDPDEILSGLAPDIRAEYDKLSPAEQAEFLAGMAK